MTDEVQLAKERGEKVRSAFEPLARVIAALQHHDPMTQAIFWLSPNSVLNGARPVDYIDPFDEELLRAAQMYGEQGCI